MTDAQTIIAAIVATVTVGMAIAGIAMHAGTSRSLANSAIHRVRNVEDAHHGFVAHADRTYVRKETLMPQLDDMKDALKRIEDRQSMLWDRPMGPGA